MLVADASGTVSLSLIYRTPTPIPLTPRLPPGATRAMRLQPGPNLLAIVLGGRADPFLKSFRTFGGAQPGRYLAGPLPGDPADFFLVPKGAPTVLSFGSGCAGVSGRTPQIDGGVTGGPPRIGNPTFELAVHDANPSVVAVLALGLDDRAVRGIPLPLQITARCSLHHSAEVTVTRGTSAAGSASVVLPVPNDPRLVGVRLFAQWFVPGGQGGAPLSASGAAVVHVWR